MRHCEAIGSRSSGLFCRVTCSVRDNHVPASHFNVERLSAASLQREKFHHHRASRPTGTIVPGTMRRGSCWYVPSTVYNRQENPFVVLRGAGMILMLSERHMLQVYGDRKKSRHRPNT
eukprot:scaffold145_cov54-Attheya_sp.AAC.8